MYWFWSVLVGRNCGLTHHDRVNEGINQNKDPDRRRHVADASPHADHGSSMMICLQKAALLAFGDDDESINNLVELGHVEEPAVEC